MRGLVPLALAVALLATPSASAQPAVEREPISIPAGGTDVFRAFLDRQGIKPITHDDLAHNRIPRYDEVIVIILGARNQGFVLPVNPIEYARLVINHGGGVLIASDSAMPLLGHVWRRDGDGQDQGWIEPSRVECPNPKANLDERPFCPFPVPININDRVFGAVSPDRRTALGKMFNGDPEQGLRPLTRVATNNPGVLYVSGFSGHFRFALARYPRGSVIRLNDVQTAPLPEQALFAVGHDGPDPDNVNSRYHFLAMADHSVFINQMLLEPGTDNLELTYRVIDYLRNPDPNNPKASRRKRCLFIENGQIVERFDELRQAFKQGMPIPSINWKALQGYLVDTGNAVVDAIQTRDVPNKMLVGGFGLPAIMRFLVLLLTIYAVWYVLRRVFGSRKPGDLPPAPTVAGAPTGPPGVFDRRQKELLRRNNVYEPVRDLLREFFVSVGVPGDPGPKHPRLVIADVIRKPESLRKAIKDFWKLAYGPPAALTVSRWREMKPYFERVRQAHADGKWQFVSEDATAGSVA